MILDLEKTCVGGNKEAKGDKKGNGTLRTSSSFYTQETTHLSCPVKPAVLEKSKSVRQT
jgi:hypothetical protein